MLINDKANNNNRSTQFLCLPLFLYLFKGFAPSDCLRRNTTERPFVALDGDVVASRTLARLPIFTFYSNALGWLCW